MNLNIQGIVDRVHERSFWDKFKPVSQYEYKQREGRHSMDSAQLNDEVVKMREALEAAGIKVAEKATDAEIITAMLTEEQNFGKQMEVNEYNERVTRYNEGSLVERVRIMFNGAPTKPQVNPVTEEDFYEEKTSYTKEPKNFDGNDVSKEDAEELADIFSTLEPEDFERLKSEGKEEEAMQLAAEVQNILKANIQADLA